MVMEQPPVVLIKGIIVKIDVSSSMGLELGEIPKNKIELNHNKLGTTNFRMFISGTQVLNIQTEGNYVQI